MYQSNIEHVQNCIRSILKVSLYTFLAIGTLYLIIGFLYLSIRSESPCHMYGKVALLQAVIDLNNPTASFELGANATQNMK